MSSAESNRPIVTRFFESLDALVTMDKIKSIRAFCTSYGIDRRNLDALRKSEERNLLQTFWLVPLVNEYGVNARWLLTGKGKMFS